MNIFYPIQMFADWTTYNFFRFEPGTAIANAVNFFIFDTLKILLLLIIIIFTVSIIRSFLPPDKIKKILSHDRRFIGHIIASLLGIITPFCTCSAVPLFMGFLEAGVPLGITFSFLVASPMINEIVAVLLFGMFGWKIALSYISSGFLIAVFSGAIIGKLNVGHLVEEPVYKNGSDSSSGLKELGWDKRIFNAQKYTIKTVKKVWLYMVIGIGIGAWIHGYVPEDFLVDYLGNDNWYAVPLAVLIGIPLYSNAAGIIPLAGVLIEKGIPVGTSLAFMMAVSGLSTPEFLILRRVMKMRLIAIFAGVVGLGIIFTGYLFNMIL